MRVDSTTSEDLLTGGFRLDASYHANDGTRAYHHLKRWASSTSHQNRIESVGDVCMPNGIFIGGRARRIYVDDPAYGVQFLSSSDMLSASFDGVKYISRKQPELDSLLLKSGWTLISRSGTIGNTAYVRQDMEDLAGSEHIMRVVPDPQKILSGYLYAFLSSPLGVSMIRQGTFGAVVDTIAPDYIASLPIPRLEPEQEQRIHELIEQAAELRVQANQRLRQAQDALDTLMFGDAKEKVALMLLRQNRLRFGNTLSSDVFSGDLRLDASYHASLGHAVYKLLISSGAKLKRLDQVCLPGGVFIPGRFKRMYVNNPSFGAPYLTGGFILNIDPLRGAKLLSLRQIASKEKLVLHEKMILITCSGIIGNTVYVNANFRGAVGSPDLIRVVADPGKILSGYLFAYLRSPVARLLIQQKTYGAVIPHIEAHHLFDLPVPRFDLVEERQIHRLIEDASDFQVQANERENQAQNVLSIALGVSDRFEAQF